MTNGVRTACRNCGSPAKFMGMNYNGTKRRWSTRCDVCLNMEQGRSTQSREEWKAKQQVPEIQKRRDELLRQIVELKHIVREYKAMRTALRLYHRKKAERTKARKENKRGGTRCYTRFKKTSCEDCGLKPEYAGELDVHHIDRNRRNNNPSNLRTLCARCHRREHFKSQDHLTADGGQQPLRLVR